MPRIRKKTSKRGTTFQRSKVKHKVAESKKKIKKAAKKNPQWKSKHAKDPGIPNNFPYKDQILAEVAAQRRRDEEERQKRKEQRKAEKAAAKAGGAEKDEDDQAEEDVTGFDGISSVSPSALKTTAKASSAKGKERTLAVEEDEEVPILMNSEYTDLKSVLDKADVVLQILDARDPFAYQSTHLQRYIGEKGKGKIFMILNKIDTCPRETVQPWVTTLRKQHPTYLFRSASAFLPKVEEQGKASASKAGETTVSLTDAVGIDALLKALAIEASNKSDGPLSVALIGVANTGKSSILNSLLRKSISPIYKLSSVPAGPSTTERPLEVTLEHDGKHINFIDTPALSWIPPADLDGAAASKLRAKDVLLRNKGRIDRVKEPLVPVTDIVARANAEDLMLFYTLPAFTPGDATAFLSALARAQGLVKRRGEVDLVSAARVVLRDWSTGRLPRFASPPSPSSSSPSPSVATKDAAAADAGKKVYAEDEALLKAAPLRKEMRKGRGIVRLVSGSVETREAALDVPWDEEKESEEEGEGVAEGEESVDEDEMDEDVEISDGDGDEDEDEDEPPPPTAKGKRKRHEKSAPAPASSKKVTFAARPAGSKQARAYSNSAKAAPKMKKLRK